VKKGIVYSFFSLVLIVFSCQSLDKGQKPENLLSEDKMVEILTDIAFVKAAKGSYKKVFDVKKINPESYILKKHGVDSLVFAENNNWYINQLDEYEEIFKRVKNNLEKSKVKFEKLKKEEDSIQKIKDSIKKATKGIKLEKKSSIDEEFLIEEEIENAIKKRNKSKPIPPSGKKKQ